VKLILLNLNALFQATTILKVIQFGIHTYMAFHFINPYKPLSFGYETCLQDLTNSNRYTQNKMYTHKIKMVNMWLSVVFIC